MLDRGKRILNALYHALVGFNLGFLAALLLAQWTWLELRANTGLLIVAGCLIGLIYGWFREGKRPLSVGPLAVGSAWAASLAIAGGSLESMGIVVGVMFREGTLLPDLPLVVADGIAMGLGLLTVLVSWVQYRTFSPGFQPSQGRHT